MAVLARCEWRGRRGEHEGFYKLLFELHSARCCWGDTGKAVLTITALAYLPLLASGCLRSSQEPFPVVRMNEAPAIDIILVNSTEKRGGIGEPAAAVVVPAIANAMAALSGKRVRKLPMTADVIGIA